MLLFFTGLAGLTGNPAAPGRADAAPVSAVLIGTRIRTRSTHTWAGVCRCKRASSRLGFWPRCNLVSSVGRRMPRLLNLDDAFLSRRSRQNHIQEEPLRTTIHSPLLQLTFMELGTDMDDDHSRGDYTRPELSTWTPLPNHLSLSILPPSMPSCQHVHRH